MRWPISCACSAARSRVTWPTGIRPMNEDDDGVLPLPSLMEAWRPPTGGKRSLRGGTLRIRSGGKGRRSEEHTSELQSLMRISYAVFCLKKKNTQINKLTRHRPIRTIHKYIKL